MTSFLHAPPLDFRRLYEAQNEVSHVVSADEDYTIVAVSDGLLAATQHQRSDLIGRPLFEVFPDNPDDASATGVGQLRASFERVLRTRAPDTMPLQKYDVRRPERDGGGYEARYWRVVNSPVFGEDGQVTHLHHRGQEVTDEVRRLQRSEADRLAIEALQKTQVELRESGVWLSTVLSSIGDAVIATDAQGRVTFLNPVAERLTGWTRDEALGTLLTQIFRIVHEGTRAQVPSPADQVLRDGQVVLPANHTLLLRRDGTELPIDDSAAPIRDAQGRLTGVVLVFRDVAEKKRLEAERAEMLARAQAARAEVEAERTRLRNLVQHAPAFICTLRGPDHVFELANPHYERLVGVGRPFLGLPVRDALPEVVEQGFVALLDTVYRTGEPYYGSELLVRLDREGHGTAQDAYVNFVYQPRRGVAGQVEGIDVFGFEVTEQVRARQQVEALAARLRESEARLRRVVEASGTGTWELDVARKELVADARFRELLGLSSDAPFSIDQAFSTVHPDGRERAARTVADALAGKNGGLYRDEYRTLRFPDGRYQWVEARGQATFGPDGTPVRMEGTGVDITARKEAEAAREGLLEALAAQPYLQVAVLEAPAFVYRMANSAYREQLASGRDIVGLPLQQALPELEVQGSEALLRQVVETGVPWIGREVPATFDSGDGRRVERFFNIVYQPVRGPDGAIDTVLALSHEVTDIVNARQRAEQLVAQDKERADFEQQLIGIVSHDLRSPISAILLGANALLRREGLDDRAMRAAVRIHSSAQRAARMVRDLLDFTQARLAGGIPIRPQPTNLYNLVRSVAEEVQATHPERNLHLSLHGNLDGIWDGDRLTQVLTNLLVNALKYGSDDTAVSVRAFERGDGVRLEVHNFGPPIPPESLERLFEPMQRGTDRQDPAGRSVGLGLYIVQQIVMAHGGTLSVRSTDAEGTTFTVELPRESSEVM